ncbi:2-amino-4-hydroxy-6-hydroxymethyldihydropteridine diphosphokinase [Moorena producens]|uniref:2-amino-4-hydroxy-6- hydroxymethyldihydropteridine diphosphokinase n=1 Tax=Moorena producens TaxID=1155739 RepID=UPI003C77ECC7
MTKTIGFTEQHNFINGAFLIHTEDSFETFRQKLKQEVRPVANLILNAESAPNEIDQGRVKQANKNRPRCIDLDIVVWNRRIVDPDFYQRDFIKKTVLELIPDLKV